MEKTQLSKDRIRESWHVWLSSNYRGWRLLVGTIFVFCLAFFLHFREVRVEVLEVNNTASRYIVSQVDFDFPDYETTIVLRQLAMQEVGAIQQIDDRQIRDARHTLEDHLIRNRSWRTAVPSSSFEEIYKAADEMETLLLEARFTDPRTIQKVKELNLPDNSYYEYISETTQPTFLPDEFWEKISKQIAQSDVFGPAAIDYVVRSFQQREWSLAEDKALQRSLCSQVARTIPERMTKVQAGTRVIDQGERITSRHLTMIQSMKQAISESRKIWDPLTMISSLILSIIFVSISGFYFRISQPDFIGSLRQISLFVCIVLLTLLFAKLTEYILLKSSSNVIQAVRYPIFTPFATILICILLSQRTALFAATVLSILLTVSLAVDQSQFLILNLVTSIVVIISTENLRKRKEVFTICLKSWLSSIPVLYAFGLAERHLASYTFLSDCLSSLAFLMITAIMVVGILPALESIFGVLTDMTLMEYLDPNNELIRRFSLEVPGTYQHSLALGNLAESCAAAIGANSLFCRVATLYHDIGKLNNPQFYVENQQNAVNMHQLLTPQESAQVIISHVTEGEALARKARLPQSFIDIIREHHGSTLVYYFYRKQLEMQGDGEIDQTKFRYPGPKPRSKESAIIMICDSIEAASRTQENVTEHSLRKMIETLISEKAEDGQFDHCHLTFEELGRVKQTLVKTLMLSNHIRIKYPKRV